jgi:hypothetical protein
MVRRWAAVLSMAAWLVPAGFAGVREPESVRWKQLEARIGGNKVALVLPDGTHVEGRARGVLSNALLLKVSKTSDRKVVGKGVQKIPRESVTLLRLTEYRKAGRLLTTLGALAVAAGVLAAQQVEVYEGPGVLIVPAVVVGGMAGVGAAGYYTGKAIDRRVVTIRVIADEPAPPRGYRLLDPQRGARP